MYAYNMYLLYNMFVIRPRSEILWCMWHEMNLVVNFKRSFVLVIGSTRRGLVFTSSTILTTVHFHSDTHRARHRWLAVHLYRSLSTYTTHTFTHARTYICTIHFVVVDLFCSVRLSRLIRQAAKRILPRDIFIRCQSKVSDPNNKFHVTNLELFKWKRSRKEEKSIILLISYAYTPAPRNGLINVWPDFSSSSARPDFLTT